MMFAERERERESLETSAPRQNHTLLCVAFCCVRIQNIVQRAVVLFLHHTAALFVCNYLMSNHLKQKLPMV